MKNKILITIICLILGTQNNFAQRATAVEGVAITVGDLDAETAFFTGTLGFEKIAEESWQGPEVAELFGLSEPSVALRSARLRLGQEQIRLMQFSGAGPGRPVPPDTRGLDRWFQHLAIVVSDLDSAYQTLLARDVTHVSTAPQTLPGYLPNAAGIRAFYFRDPEGHNLELIWFPADKGDPRWQASVSSLQSAVFSLQSSVGSRLKTEDCRLPTENCRLKTVFLGIDHTAITIGDTKRSLGFYRDGLGLTHGGHSENYGPEQEHLNQVFGARLDINGLHAGTGPGVEFLRYIAPPGGRPYPPDSRPTDLWHYQTEFRVEKLDSLLEKMTRNGYQAISSQIVQHRNQRLFLLRDPDGHAVLLVEE